MAHVSIHILVVQKLISLFTMERLFSPCTRLHDVLRRNMEDNPVNGELPDFIVHPVRELILNVSTEQFLSASSTRSFTYADLHDLLGSCNEENETIVWFTPHAAVVRENGRAESYYARAGTRARVEDEDEDAESDDESEYENGSLIFNADSKEISVVGASSELILEICDVILRLLAASDVHSVALKRYGFSRMESINAPTLAYLMEQCQNLKALSLNEIDLDEDHCRILRTYSRPDLEIELQNCSIADDAVIAQGNQGPTGLHGCDGYCLFLLADELRENTRLKSFTHYLSDNFGSREGNREILAISDALRENKGLLQLSLIGDEYVRNEETWSALCNSLKTHPTLEGFNLCSQFNLYSRHMPPPALATDMIVSRLKALVDMIKVNTSIHTIRVDFRLHDHEIYRELVIPYLETNRFRPRLLAIQKTQPIAYRAKVLGRALVAARTNANTFWMLLSGNTEVAFCATTASTGTTIVASTVAESVICPLTTNAPVASHKRKAPSFTSA
jgi:hypothetical protein